MPFTNRLTALGTTNTFLSLDFPIARSPSVTHNGIVTGENIYVMFEMLIVYFDDHAFSILIFA